MLSLLTFPAGFGQFSLSPFCVKAAYLLAASGQTWRREDMHDPRKMPHAKLPVLRTPDGLVPDSSRIAAWLTEQGAEFQPGLSDLQKAQAQAIISLAEDRLYFDLVMDRWGNDAVWPCIRDTYFTVIPAIVRRPVTHAMRRQVQRGLAFQGVARLTDKERMARCDLALLSLATLVSANGFVMADVPTLADFSVAPMLAAMMATPVETALSVRVAGDPVLPDYVARVQAAVPLP